MPSYYVHIGEQDVVDMERARRGLLDAKAMPRPALMGDECWSCGTTNPPTRKWCATCRKPVSPEAATAQDERRLEEAKASLASLLTEELKIQLAQQIRQELEAVQLLPSPE